MDDQNAWDATLFYKKKKVDTQNETSLKITCY